MASFDFKVTPDIIRSFGLLKYIDLGHESIRSMKRLGRAVYASLRLTDDERAGLAPGDFLMMPEIGSIPGKWQIEPPKEGVLQICAPGTTELTFAEFADDNLPQPPEPQELTLMSSAGAIANGRLTKLSEMPAFAIEEIL